MTDELVNKKGPMRVEMRDRYFSFSSMSAPQEDAAPLVTAAAVTDFEATFGQYGVSFQITRRVSCACQR